MARIHGDIVLPSGAKIDGVDLSQHVSDGPSHGNPPETTKVYVDVNRSDSYTETGSSAFPFKTIASAISEVEAGDVIVLAPGSYTESVTLPDNISLIGGGLNRTTITGNVNTGATTCDLSDFSINGSLTLNAATNITNVNCSGTVTNNSSLDALNFNNDLYLNTGSLNIGAGSIYYDDGKIKFSNTAIGSPDEGAELFKLPVGFGDYDLLSKNSGGLIYIQDSDTAGHYLQSFGGGTGIGYGTIDPNLIPFTPPTSSPTMLSTNVYDAIVEAWGSGSGGITVESDPIFTAWDKSTGISITESQISDFGTYLTSESDPVFVASAAYGITGTNITNWDTAYGWGDHGTEGYLKAEDISENTLPPISSLTGNHHILYSETVESPAGWKTLSPDSIPLNRVMFLSTSKYEFFGEEYTNAPQWDAVNASYVYVSGDSASPARFNNTSPENDAYSVQDAIEDIWDELQAIGSVGSAASIDFSPSSPGLDSTNVQDAVDEVYDELYQHVDATSGTVHGLDLADVQSAVGDRHSHPNMTALDEYIGELKEVIKVDDDDDLAWQDVSGSPGSPFQDTNPDVNGMFYLAMNVPDGADAESFTYNVMGIDLSSPSEVFLNRVEPHNVFIVPGSPDQIVFFFNTKNYKLRITASFKKAVI